MMKKAEEIKLEKMIIDIPVNTQAVSVVTIASTGNTFQQVMNTRTYSTEDVKERIIKSEVNKNEK